MPEIKCPHCSQVFQVDESGYAAILNQVRDNEFEKALANRMENIQEKYSLEKNEAVRNAVHERETLLNKTISELEKQIAALQERLDLRDNQAKEALDKFSIQKQAEIQSMQAKVDTALQEKSVMESRYLLEMEQVKQRISEEKGKEISLLQEQLNKAKHEEETLIAKLDYERLQAVTLAEQAKDKQINDKESQISMLKVQLSMIAETERLKSEKELSQKLEEEKLRFNEMESSYKYQLQIKDEELAQAKDFKARLSTKMIGETLEQHCQTMFDRNRSIGFQNCYFEKDNDSRTGSKGDFIFRAFDDEQNEIVSIMFEMKNESETTATKHKNTDFFKELDKDRQEKKCEYAVLVSMLEAENEYYNDGIVDVSHYYDKMYVIRPQFFIPIITLLRNAAEKSLQYKKALDSERKRNIDVTNFETKLNDLKTGIHRNWDLAGRQFNKAIEEIDKTIEHLTKVKESLISSSNNLTRVQKKVDGITIRKLTNDNPTMKKAFEEARQNTLLIENDDTD